MTLKDLFIIRSPKQSQQVQKGEAVPAARQKQEATGIFITPKSIATFPIASFVVTVVWLLLKRLFPAWGTSDWVPVGVSLFVGLVIFVMTTSDPEAKPKTWHGWFVASSIALFNSLYLAAAALGLLKTISGQ